VAPLAQALKRAEPEFVDIATVRLDVIAGCRSDDAALQAELAERMPSNHYGWSRPSSGRTQPFSECRLPWQTIVSKAVTCCADDRHLLSGFASTLLASLGTKNGPLTGHEVVTSKIHAIPMAFRSLTAGEPRDKLAAS